jgi:hypothetical protein
MGTSFVRGNRRRFAAITMACAACALEDISVHADLIVTSWLGGVGSWSTASNWSGGVIPNNSGSTSFDVRIDAGNSAGSAVTMQGSPPITIDGLTIDAGDELDMSPSGSLTITGQLTVNGTLRPRILTLGTNPTLAGNGLIYIDSSPLGRASIRAGVGAVTIGDGITIRGGFYSDPHYAAYNNSVGSPNAPLVNRGRISAGSFSGSPGYMIVVAGSTIDNQGILETLPNGILGIDADFSFASIGSLDYRSGSLMIFGTLDNTAQALHIDQAHGGFYLGGVGQFGDSTPTSTIRGGTVTTADGKALIVSAGAVGSLDGVTLSGKVVARGWLQVPAGQAFRGSADIFFDNPQFLEDRGRIAARSGTTLIEPGIRIHGGTVDQGGFSQRWATVGNPGAALVNRGTIHADVPGQRIFLLGSSITNSGTFRVDAGAEIVADSSQGSLATVVFASGGELIVGGGGRLRMDNAVLDLQVPGDVLTVLPLPGGGAYTGQTIVSGFYIGTFDSVTPGISVQYAGPEVRIFGTPIPEPSAFVLASLLLGAGGTRPLARARSRCSRGARFGAADPLS